MMILTIEETQKFVSEMENATLFEFETGDTETALSMYLNLWNKLPEPKENQPEQIANSLINCLFDAYFDMGNYSEAKKWAKKGLEYNQIDYSTNEYIQMGMVCYELEEYDEAMKYFQVAYERGKKRAFQGIDKKYWAFYSKNKK